MNRLIKVDDVLERCTISRNTPLINCKGILSPAQRLDRCAGTAGADSQTHRKNQGSPADGAMTRAIAMMCY